MGIAAEELPGGITKVILDGWLDVLGAAAVDSQMNAIGQSKMAVLVDLQGVSFVGSVGLRLLLLPARAIKSRGGKIVLFGPNQSVERVLKAGGLDTVVPVYHELESALAALR